MSKVITFSRVFPGYHPKAGQPTYFVEQVIKGLPYSLDDDAAWGNIELCKKLSLAIDQWKDLGRKYHTIRAGHRFKAGECFSPRVWSGKPYNSKQIQFAPDIQIVKTWDFQVDGDGCFWIISDNDNESHEVLERLANNDGLSFRDFEAWFTLSPDYRKEQEFNGQIICWNESIEY